ncbi:MAG: ParB/RepB/Spo0J family partition protein [Candidatus Dormibacteraceae bacterium]
MTPLSDRSLPTDLAIVPVENVHPSPLQPRTSVSMDLVSKLAESIRAGRHDPLLEVEPIHDLAGHYQIICGEQRWRAAKAAGLERVLVRIHERLGSLQRLQKQYEENRLRADLTAHEDAQVLLLAKALRDIEVAEKKLTQADISFQPLDDTELTELVQIHQHLDGLKGLLLENGINVIKGPNGPTLGHLSRWQETERALGVSEAARKLKVSVLRLEPEVVDDVKALPTQHAPLIARVEGGDRRAELAKQAAHLTHRQLHAAVSRLRRDPNLSVADAVAGGHSPGPEDPLAFQTLLVRLADLSRQLIRMLAILRCRETVEERAQINRVLADLITAARDFEVAS